MKFTMKRFLSLLLAALFVLGMTACGETEPTPTQ